MKLEIIALFCPLLSHQLWLVKRHCAQQNFDRCCVYVHYNTLVRYMTRKAFRGLAVCDGVPQVSVQ